MPGSVKILPHEIDPFFERESEPLGSREGPKTFFRTDPTPQAMTSAFYAESEGLRRFQRLARGSERGAERMTLVRNVSVERSPSGPSMNKVLQALQDCLRFVQRGLGEVYFRWKSGAPGPLLMGLAFLLAKDSAAFDPTDRLIRKLEDKAADSRWIRAVAAHRLGVNGDAKAIEPLFKAILNDENNKDNELREAASKALVQLGAGTVEFLIPKLKDPDFRTRQQAVEILGKIGSPHSLPFLLPLFSDSNSEIRRQVAYALGEIRDLSSVQPLLELIEDPSWVPFSDVRMIAASSLALLDLPPETAASFQAILEYPNISSDIKLWIRLASGDAEAIRGLVRYLVDKFGWKDRLLREQFYERFVNAAARLGPLAIPKLLHFLQPGIPEQEKNLAMQALVKIGAPAVPFLFELLKESDDRWRRVSVLGALRQIKDPQVLEPLFQELDSVLDKKYPATGALRNIAKFPASDLIEKLNQFNEDEREFFLSVLGELRDPRLIAPFLQRLHGDRRYAEPLASFGQTVVEPLIQMLDHPNLDVHRNAAATLALIGDPRSADPLLKKLSEGDEALNKSIVDALARIGDPEHFERWLEGVVGQRLAPSAIENLKKIGWNLDSLLWLETALETRPEAIAAVGKLILAWPEHQLSSLEVDRFPLLQAFFRLHEETLLKALSAAFPKGEYQKIITRLTRIYPYEGKVAFFRKAYSFYSKEALFQSPEVQQLEKEFLERLREGYEEDPMVSVEQTLGFSRLERIGDAATYGRYQKNRFLLLSVLMGPKKTPSFEKLRKKLEKQKIDFATFVEEELPSALYGLKDTLRKEQIPLGEDFAYVPLEKLVFRPAHYAVSRSKVEGYEKELGRGAAFPGLEVIPLENGEFWVKEGHHRAAAAFLSGADYIKVRITREEASHPYLDSSPFLNDRPVPIRFILLNDVSWEEEVR